MSFLTAHQLYKGFDADVQVLRGMDLDVELGEIRSLLGASGCGKTTLLRILAGIVEADRGEIRLQGEDMRRVPAHARRFGFMFQDHALFPHRSVGDNIAYGLRMLRWSRTAVAERVGAMLDLVRLTGYGDRRIQELSGGEAQRVALARSLAPQPRVLLLDEPLASLDRTLRDELVSELRTILSSLSITSVYVTHDQEEAFAIADRVTLMHEGRALQTDTPLAMYLHPGTAYAAEFLGMRNVLPLHGEFEGLRSVLPGSASNAVPSRSDGGYLLIRPDALAIGSRHPEDDTAEIQVMVQSMTFRGRHYDLNLRLAQSGLPKARLTLELSVADTAPQWIDRLQQARDQRKVIPLVLRRSRCQLLAR